MARSLAPRAVSPSRPLELPPVAQVALAAWADRYAEIVLRCLEGTPSPLSLGRPPDVLTAEHGKRYRVGADEETMPSFARQQFVARARRSGRAMAERGQWFGRAPFGYRRLACAEDRRSITLENGAPCPKGYSCTLVPEPVEAALVRWMFEAYAASQSTSGDVLRELRDRIQTAGPGGGPLRPDLKWTLASMFSRLHSVTYLGTIRYGRRHYARDGGTIIHDDADCVIVRDTHPALVTQTLFDTVQRRVHQNRATPLRAPNPLALSGVVKCARCGGHFRGRAGRIGPPTDPFRYRSYIDVGGEPRSDGSTPPCLHPIATISGVKLEGAVIDVITDLAESDPAQAAVRAALRRRWNEPRGRPAQARARLEQQRQRLALGRQRLLEAVEVGALSLADVKARMAVIEGEVRQLEMQATRIAGAAPPRRSRRPTLAAALTLAQDFPGVCRRIVGPELRELLVPWIDEAVFDKASRTLTLTLRAPWEPAAPIVVRRVQLPARAQAATLPCDVTPRNPPHERRSDLVSG